MKTGLIARRFARIRQGALRALAFAVFTTGLAGHAHADGNGNADVVTGIGCMEEESGISLGCTANDISLANASNIVIVDDGCNAIGDTVTFSADFEVLLTAQNRHDIGIWFSTDGDPNGDASKSGQCTAASPPFGPAPAWTDIDTPLGVADACGDITSDNNPLFPNVELTVTCIDPDGDGKLNLPNCTSWRQPGANEICNSAQDAFPGAPSKCKCDEGFSVDIDVPPPVYTITKVVVDGNGDPIPGDTTSFGFQFTPSGAGGAVPGQHTLTGGASEGGELQVGAYAVTETISDPAYELDNWSCTINGLNGLKNVSSGSQILNVTIAEGDGALDCIVTNKLVFVEAPDIAIDKTPETQTILSGETASFTLNVTNPGNVSLDNITVTDAQCSTGPTFSGGDTDGDNSLDVGETWTYDCEIANVTSDLTNTASVTGDSPAGVTVDDEDSADVTVLTPSLSVDKELTGNADEDGSGDVSVGDTLSYTIIVNNNGTATLNNVTVVDSLTGDNASCATLAPDADCILNVTYQVQASDTGGTISNTATGDSDETGPEDDTVDVPVPTPSLTVSKVLDGNADEDGSGDVSVGDTLSYTITANNNGTANLTNVTVEDSLTGDSTSCASLAPGTECVLSVTYQVQTGDVGGTISNTGVGNSDQTGPEDDTVDVPVPTPSLAIDKQLTGNADEDGSGDVSAGDTLSYTITATNNGTANLTNISVSDDLTGDSTSCVGPIVPGGTCVLNVNYVVQVNDLGTTISNTGTADSDQTDPETDTEDVPVPTPSLAIDKQLTGNADEDGSSDVSAGDTLSYTITATNNGTANLINISVSDNLTGDSISCAGPILPGGTCVLNATYVVQESDLGTTINNTGTADSDQTGPETDVEEVPVPTPSLMVVKTLDSNADEDGNGEVSLNDTLTYTISVTNDGTANLTNVVAADDLTGASETCSFLAPGDSCVLTTTYVVQQSDVDAGEIVNTGTGDSTQTPEEEDPNEEPVPQYPEISIDKEFDPDMVTAGGAGGSFTLVVENTGNVTLAPVSVADTVDSRLVVSGVTGSAGSNADTDGNAQTIEWSIATLAPGGSATITVDYSVAANVLASIVDNTADVTGTSPPSCVSDPSCDGMPTDTDTDPVEIVTDINLSIVKTFSPDSVPQGTAQSFTLVVSNAGPSDAVDVSVIDMVDSSLTVTNVTGTDCSASSGQVVDCTVQLPAGTSQTITVDYTAAAFLPGNGSGNVANDFRFVFVNGTVLESINGQVFLNGVATGETHDGNDFVFNPPDGSPAFTMHLSCSDAFTGGWGSTDGPVEGVDTNWQVSFFSIARYRNGENFKNCGNLVIPYDVDNTATASGEDSSPEPDVVSDTDTVTLEPGIRLDRLQTNGKRLTVRLTNFTGDDKEIADISIDWPASNGNLKKITLATTVWTGNLAPSSQLISNGDAGWNVNGDTLATGEGILRFNFAKRSANSGYTIRVNFTDGTFLDIMR